MSAILALLALSAAATPAQVPVFTGRIDKTPSATRHLVERRMPTGDLIQRVEKMISDGTCTLAGQHDRRFNVNIPFAVATEPARQVKKVVVEKLGCPQLEILVAQIVIDQAKRGDFQPEFQQGEHWYVGELGFSSGELKQAGAVPNADKDKIICQAPKPVLGSRVQTKRRCMTIIEWQAFAADRDQVRRDIQNTPDPLSNSD
jgi:hypothetical protein